MEFQVKYLGKILFLVSHFFIFLQIYTIFYSGNFISNEKDKFQFYEKIYFVLSSLAIVCNLRSSFTDPGKINLTNNIKYLDFYYMLRKTAIIRAGHFNRKHKDFLLKQANASYNSDFYDDLTDLSEDEYIYDEKGAIKDEDFKSIMDNFEVTATRCKKCHVVRDVNTHHCKYCRR